MGVSLPSSHSRTTPGRFASGYSTGVVMPQNGMNYDGRRGGTRHSTCRVNSQVPGTGVVNGAGAHNGWPAAATESTVNGAEPPCVVNGDVNHWYKGKSKKAAPPRTLGKQQGTASAVTEASAAGGVRSAASPGEISVKGDAAASPCSSERIAPQIILSATAKNQRRRERVKPRKRNTAVFCLEKPPLPLMPPREEEDWEKEITEVTLIDWEKNCYGVEPYGPQDVIHFAFRDSTLQQTDTVDLPVTAAYSPAAHHQHPVQWRCYGTPTERDQFADADE
ncbi:uncharacterized protein LOC116396975 [Anarrhichthys ocellatus]|uniref:uncharacterized protein LOC116396975 n=1 Tax=Anarrhichthys ocellatus TaxID=433405 RepID=UPI0012ECD84F|nr:uncharacterized protein LOC116396975 [Anarrhichthys ocellatus]